MKFWACRNPEARMAAAFVKSQATELFARDGGFNGRSGLHRCVNAKCNSKFGDAAIIDDRTDTPQLTLNKVGFHAPLA
jgi:hypothetical protein